MVGIVRKSRITTQYEREAAHNRRYHERVVHFELLSSASGTTSVLAHALHSLEHHHRITANDLNSVSSCTMSSWPTYCLTNWPARTFSPFGFSSSASSRTRFRKTYTFISIAPRLSDELHHTSYPRSVPMTLRLPFSWTKTRFSRYCIRFWVRAEVRLLSGTQLTFLSSG